MINNIRGYHKNQPHDLKLDFYHLDTTNPIHIQVMNEDTRDLCITVLKKNISEKLLQTDTTGMISNVEEDMHGLLLDFHVNGVHFSSQLHRDSAQEQEITRIVDNHYQETMRCMYLSPKYDFNASIQGLKTIIQNKDEAYIVEGLQLIEPKVKDFVFTDNEMLVDIGLPRRIPVNMLGDGARKIVSLLTAVYDCKNGALLIDEISNGFHHSVMCSLWKVLINAAHKNDTQLFVTTHDIDSIKGLRDAALPGYESSVASFRLLKTSDDILQAFHYSLQSLDYSITQEIEVR